MAPMGTGRHCRPRVRRPRRKWSGQTKAFYEMKRAAGFRRRAAVRALAYKWIRSIYRLWKTRTTYNENLYIEQLKTRYSPIIKFLETI